MKASFVGQPFLSHGGWTASLIEGLLANLTFGRLDVAVAWMKRSGLSRIEEAMRAFREHGGSASVIVGIDEGGATAQGLRLALELFDSVHVFHDPGPGRRTFHPKVYLFAGDSSAVLLVGSNNATAGGLFSNYEGTLCCELDLQGAADRELFDTVRLWFEALYSDTEVCLPLGDRLLETLIADPSYRVGDEDRVTRRTREGEEDYDGVAIDAPGNSLFGTSSTVKAGLAPSVPQVRPTVGPQPRHPRPARPPVGQVTHRWWKRLTPSDAQRPPTATSAPTGNLRLSKAGHDIDHKSYFRHDFFGGAGWSVQQEPRGPKESATVTFEVFVEGTPLGRYRLVVDHAEYRIANQNNVPTVLHWGPLGPILRQQDYSGASLILERYQDGSYRLEIRRTAPGGSI